MDRNNPSPRGARRIGMPSNVQPERLVHPAHGAFVWGTLLLFIDCILLILLYERLSRMFRRNAVAAAFVGSAIVLSFDQLAFFPVLHWVTGTPFEALTGGWVAKLGAAALYSVLTGVYLAVFEPAAAPRRPRPIRDIFQALTYRSRYEDLLERAHTDELTGVKNRAAFEQLRRDWLERASVEARPVAIAMADVDRFKEINDQGGHAAGDEVLRALGRALEEHLRDGDLVFRYGGEEFALVLRDVTQGEAVDVAERLRLAVADDVAAACGRRVTMSVGVATSDYGAGDLRGLLEKADKRLYEAKRLGRDRVVGEPA